MNINSLLFRVSNRITRRIAGRYGASMRMYPLIEYPKCGGTWACRMLAESLSVPFVQYSRLPVAMPCVVHGHWEFHSGLENATYLMRDGRDVMVSYYFHYTRPNENPDSSDKYANMNQLKSILGSKADLTDVRSNLPRFIEYLFENPLNCKQTWRDHTRSWINQPKVNYIKYEDLINDCHSTMFGLVSSLGCEPDKERIDRAIDQYSMSRMTGRKPGQEDASSFIRKGVVGDWKNNFTKESAQLFHDLAGDILVELGYEQDDSWVECCGDA